MVHRHAESCNTTATTTTTLKLLAANADLHAKRARRNAEPKPTAAPAQTPHDFPEKARSTKTANRPSGKITAEGVVVAEIRSAGLNAMRVVALGIRYATTQHRRDPITRHAERVAIPQTPSSVRALAFVRAVLNSQIFADVHGCGGAAFVDRLVLQLGDDGTAAVLQRLDVTAEDLDAAAEHARTVLGEDYITLAAERMAGVMIPEYIEKPLRFYRLVLGVIRLVASLTTLRGVPDVYLSTRDAARVLGCQNGDAARALRKACERGALKLVSRGGRKHRNAYGAASVYRVAWFVQQVS